MAEGMPTLPHFTCIVYSLPPKKSTTIPQGEAAGRDLRTELPLKITTVRRSFDSAQDDRDGVSGGGKRPSLAGRSQAVEKLHFLAPPLGELACDSMTERVNQLFSTQISNYFGFLIKIQNPLRHGSRRATSPKGLVGVAAKQLTAT